jgi:hypothetical protein
MSTEHERRILERIEKTGYPLEVDVTDWLIQRKWSVFPQYPFLDETRTLRSVDLIASPSPLGTLMDPSDSRSPMLVIECKKSENPWVFYCTHTTPFKTGFDDLRVRSRGIQYDSFLQQCPDYPKIKNDHRRIPERLSKKIWQIHLFDSNVPMAHSCHVTHLNSKKEDEDSPDDFRKAVHQLKGAYWALPKERRSRAVFLTIVLRGELWEFKRSNDQKRVFPMNHLHYNTLMVAPGNKPYRTDTIPPSIIDIVTDAYFVDYLSLLEKDIQICNEIWKLRVP